MGRANAAEVTDKPSFVADLMGSKFLSSAAAPSVTVGAPSPAQGLGL